MRGSLYIFCLLVKGGVELGMYRSYRKDTILIELSWGTLESGVANGKTQCSVFQEGKGSPRTSPKDLQPSRKSHLQICNIRIWMS